ncbi:SUKH-3 domain-containing protein [Streptomyces sp. NPDC014894]|uniref:SUKH-3 domain-containing protein n=1 Tax=unclassified Streptomyces TaxID=2593676 RepID=UPI0036FD3BEF
MSDSAADKRLAELRETFPEALRLELGTASLDEVCERYEASGHPVGESLRGFLEKYRELTVTWLFRGTEVSFRIDVEEALDVYPGNIKIYSKRVGRPLIPVGLAFDTEEAVLLAEDGDVFFAGDAGIQRVGQGFARSVRSLIADDWDKTFF